MDLGVRTIYKWVDDNNRTHSHGDDVKYCVFGRDKLVSKPIKPTGDYFLCTSDVLHAFATISQAFLHRGGLVDDSYTKLWKGVGNVVAIDYNKVGCQSIKLQTLVPLPSFVSNSSGYRVPQRYYMGVLATLFNLNVPRKLEDMGDFYLDLHSSVDHLLMSAKVCKANRPTVNRIMRYPEYVLEDVFRWEQNYPKQFGFVTDRVAEYDAKHTIRFLENKTE